ncbi:MAG: hypothetical protein V4653_10545 [Pseudomonadota bacterium]
MMSRDEHMAWCKARALAYLPGDPTSAVASMTSDLRKHPETNVPMNTTLATIGMMEIMRGPEAVRQWIEGFQ